MDTSIPKMKIYIPGYPDDMGNFSSITKLDICDGLYMFMLDLNENRPQVQLINFMNNLKITLYLDKPESDYNFSDYEKKYINNWMHEKHTDDFGNISSNWEVLQFIYKITYSKFEEEYNNTHNNEYDWDKIFPKAIPDYSLL